MVSTATDYLIVTLPIGTSLLFIFSSNATKGS